jgi:hypothetical protein
LLDASTSGEKIEDENNDRKNQKQMNPAAKRITAYQPDNPKNDKNNGDRPKHRYGSLKMAVTGNGHFSRRRLGGVR